MTNDNLLQPHKLVNVVGRFIYCHVINLLEVAIYNSHKACFCTKYDACAPHHHSDSYYACELCQLITDYCPYYFENKINKDPIKLIKAASDIFNRCKIIGQIVGEREHVVLGDITNIGHLAQNIPPHIQFLTLFVLLICFSAIFHFLQLIKNGIKDVCSSAAQV